MAGDPSTGPGDQIRFTLHSRPAPHDPADPTRRHVRVEVIGRQASPDDVARLAIAPGTPVLDVRRTIYDHDGGAIKDTHTTCPGPRTVLMHSYPINPPTSTGPADPSSSSPQD